ncbi:uncharacterized [Tachysurus ichikawai]
MEAFITLQHTLRLQSLLPDKGQYVPGHTSASDHKCSGMLAEHPDLLAVDDVIALREDLASGQTVGAQRSLVLTAREKHRE